MTLASTGVTSADAFSAALPDVVTDVAVDDADELEFVPEAEFEADADAAVVDVVDELSVDAD